MKKHLLLLVFLFLGSVTLLHSQITGTVKDEDGTPLPGASVVKKGTQVGTTTDFDGNFSI
ncbi:MAG: hypothetical protein HKO11_03220, partial [Eudoraea sp.]|nr:hypothetical protein [Eudoraea sp.]